MPEDDAVADANTPPNAPAPDTLVLSGGGPDGLAFIGCVRSLEARGAMARLRTVVGCSAGAIVALFVAVGLSSVDMEAWAVRGFADRSLLDVDIEGMLSLIERLGIDDGERVMTSIRGVVAARLAVVAPRLCASSARARAGDPTFMELAKATGRNLVVAVSNLEASARELLSVDTAPDLGVATAVRMSISIPILFTPVRHRIRPDGPTCTYVDGGLFDYCPIDHILASGTATSTVAFRVTLPDGGCGNGLAQTQAPTLTGYGAMLARALLMRCCSSATARPASDTTVLRVVDVPSLTLMSQDDSSPACSFSASSMSLEVDAEGLRRFIQHGMACGA
jgi:predicted acylesterase/phospholipase RssA